MAVRLLKSLSTVQLSTKTGVGCFSSTPMSDHSTLSWELRVKTTLLISDSILNDLIGFIHGIYHHHPMGQQSLVLRGHEQFDPV